MPNTLAERVKERMQALNMTNAQLARLSGVQQPTSFNWASGKTKSIKGEPLLKAAAALKVHPMWLANGTGPKFPEQGTDTWVSPADVATPIAGEASAAANEQRRIAASLLAYLNDKQLIEAVQFLRWLLDRDRPAPGPKK